ncbi:chemerin-like receptor 1 [Leptodactylus fuscus]|uniref:chemerin-like receptor 1 n=1 Tax=Leptodactylus fuscus TaxID=238119 RepID=UPI003F4EE55F
MNQEIFKSFCYMAWDIATSPELRALSPNTSHPSAIQYSSFALSIVTCIIGLVANILVIFTTGFIMKKNIYKIWFLNLALADFIFLLFLPLHAVSILRGIWPYGSNMCKFYNFLSFVNTYASIYILTALNVDRTLSVAKPVWHRRFHSQRFCWRLCALIWVSSFLISIPAIIYSDVHIKRQCTLSHYDFIHFANLFSGIFTDLEKDLQKLSLVPRKSCSDLADYYEDSDEIPWAEVTFTTMRLVIPLVVLGYVIPLCVILLSNVIIALHVKNSKMAASSRLYRVVIVSVLSFFCTRTPYVLTYIIYMVSISSLKMTLMYKLSIILPLLFSIAATNSLLNPLVYVLVGKQVRSEIINYFRKKSICV